MLAIFLNSVKGTAVKMAKRLFRFKDAAIWSPWKNGASGLGGVDMTASQASGQQIPDWQALLVRYRAEDGPHLDLRVREHHGVSVRVLLAGEWVPATEVQADAVPEAVAFFPVLRTFHMDAKTIAKTAFTFPIDIFALDAFLDDLAEDITGVWLARSLEDTFPGTFLT
jgi:hypothetical protein